MSDPTSPIEKEAIACKRVVWCSGCSLMVIWPFVWFCLFGVKVSSNVHQIEEIKKVDKADQHLGTNGGTSLLAVHCVKNEKQGSVPYSTDRE